jgi:hypothetical protein
LAGGEGEEGKEKEIAVQILAADMFRKQAVQQKLSGFLVFWRRVTTVKAVQKRSEKILNSARMAMEFELQTHFDVLFSLRAVRSIMLTLLYERFVRRCNHMTVPSSTKMREG